MNIVWIIYIVKLSLFIFVLTLFIRIMIIYICFNFDFWQPNH